MKNIVASLPQRAKDYVYASWKHALLNGSAGYARTEPALDTAWGLAHEVLETAFELGRWPEVATMETANFTKEQVDFLWLMYQHKVHCPKVLLSIFFPGGHKEQQYFADIEGAKNWLDGTFTVTPEQLTELFDNGKVRIGGFVLLADVNPT